MNTKELGLILIFLSLIVSACFSNAEAAEEPGRDPVPVDKAAHFGIAATAQTSCYALAKTVTRSKWGSQIGCFVLINAAGAAKEYTDPKRGGDRDVRDIYANVAGSGLSFMLIGVAF